MNQLLERGFWFLGEATHSPTDVIQDAADRADNQIDVFSKTFLGLSISCARCHNHKFDPISAADYYSLLGVIQSTHRQVGMLDVDNKISTAVAKLEEAKSIIRTNLKSRTKDISTLANYLTATKAAIILQKENNKKGVVQTIPSLDKDIVFEDFEDVSFSAWKIAGDAFKKQPIKGTYKGQQKVSGFQGQKLINTFVGTDKAKGTASSQKFKIEPQVY